MDKKIIPLFALLLLVSPASADFFTAVEDTFASATRPDGAGLMQFDNYNGTNLNLSANFNYGNLSFFPTIVIGTGGVPIDVRPFVKWNNTPIQNVGRLFNSIRLNMDLAENDCAGARVDSGWYYLTNDTWNEYTLTYNDMPTLDTSLLLYGKNNSIASGNNVSSFLTWGAMVNIQISSDFLNFPNVTNISNVRFVDDLYSDNFTSMVTRGTNFVPLTNNCGTTVGNKRVFFSLQNNTATATQPALNITFTDYINGTHIDTDLVSFSQLDFETETDLDGQNMIAFDVDYSPSLNSLVPNQNRGITIAPMLFSTTPDDDIATRIVDCFYNRFYSYNAINPNVIPSTYSYVCVNLSSGHGGRGFYGMIKFINVTNVRGNSSPELDYYFAVASPQYITFTPPTLSPNPAQVSVNLTVITLSTLNLNTKMYWFANWSGNLTTLQIVNEPFGSYTTAHGFVINGGLVREGIYYVYFNGTTPSGYSIISPTYTFNVSLPFTNQLNGTILPSAIDRLVASGVVANRSDALFLFGGIILVLGTAIAYFIGGGLKVAIAVAVTLIGVLGLMGFLPFFIIVPIIIIVVALLVIFIRNFLTGGS